VSPLRKVLPGARICCMTLKEDARNQYMKESAHHAEDSHIDVEVPQAPFPFTYTSSL
jgi:hypothetical protein